MNREVKKTRDEYEQQKEMVLDQQILLIFKLLKKLSVITGSKKNGD